MFNLNALPSVFKFDIPSTSINILSAVPIRRIGFKGRRGNPISCASAMHSERTNKIGEGILFVEGR